MKRPLFSLLLCAACLTATAQSFSTDFSCDFDAPCAMSIASKTCDFRIYPNPTIDILTIDPPPQYVRIFDLAGRDVGSLDAVPTLAQGIYFVRIKYADCERVAKIVKL